MNFFQKFRDFVASPSHSRTMGIVVMLIMVSAISLTVIASQQQQTLKQRASFEWVVKNNPEAKLKVTNSPIKTGDDLRFEYSGFEPNSEVTIGVKDRGWLTSTSDSNGAGNGGIAAIGETEGTHTLQATGTLGKIAATQFKVESTSSSNTPPSSSSASNPACLACIQACSVSGGTSFAAVSACTNLCRVNECSGQTVEDPFDCTGKPAGVICDFGATINQPLKWCDGQGKCSDTKPPPPSSAGTDCLSKCLNTNCAQDQTEACIDTNWNTCTNQCESTGVVKSACIPENQVYKTADGSDCCLGLIQDSRSTCQTRQTVYNQCVQAAKDNGADPKGCDRYLSGGAGTKPLPTTYSGCMDQCLGDETVPDNGFCQTKCEKDFPNKPKPCDAGKECTEVCNVPADNTCSTNNGTKTCTYTKLTTVGDCTPVAVPASASDPCTANKCVSPKTCNAEKKCVDPDNSVKTTLKITLSTQDIQRTPADLSVKLSLSENNAIEKAINGIPETQTFTKTAHISNRQYFASTTLTGLKSGTKYRIVAKSGNMVTRLSFTFSGQTEITVGPATLVVGDLDNNNKVDIHDYERVFKACYVGKNFPSTCASSNFNNDDTINILDFLTIIKGWNITNQEERNL